MFLPVTEAENDLPSGLRAVIYGVTMAYFFVGVAIIADTFVASIESITAKWKRVKTKDGELRTTKVWNDTVATLTLMALGSSAPEIFLAVIDVPKKNFHAAAIGPSTIVGSASFNLLVIVAVCILAIPSDEVRIIRELPAFYITAIFSLGAYVWLCFILVVNTKDQVDIWEAVVTFLLLPTLVLISYMSDVGAFDCLLEKLGMVKIVVDPAAPESTSESLHGRRHSELAKDVRSSITKNNAGPGSTISNNSDDLKSAVDSAKDKYAVLAFRQEKLEVTLTDEDQEVKIPIILEGTRSQSVVTCKVRTSSYSAFPGVEYEEIEEQALEFAEGESEQVFTLNLMAWNGNKATSQLLVIISDVEGADLDPATDGEEDMTILTVTLKSNTEPSSSKKIINCLVDLDGFEMSLGDWKDQFLTVIYIAGDPEEHAEASRSDFILHLMALPWKMIFTFVPPPSMFGGWLCFFLCLGWIGLLTSFVSDLAELFGCVLELGDVVTAITFVALGTSMPDLFASLTAAREDETADASVVNVTGSNSVNVFLGLGLPWSVCAVYWAMESRTLEWTGCYPAMAAKIPGDKMVFVVESGFIGFSVVTFSFVCMLALAVIAMRRRWIGAELGGTFLPKVVSAGQLLLLWALWVGVVVWRVLRFDEDASMMEQGVVAFSFLGIITCSMITTGFVLFKSRATPEVKEVRRMSKNSSTSGRASSEGSRDGGSRESQGAPGDPTVKELPLSPVPETDSGDDQDDAACEPQH
jgi:Ca2+/Na+ antiporter